MSDDCSTCVFFMNGGCHEAAPLYFVPAVSSVGQWPAVVSSDWCGDGISTVDGHHFSAKTSANPTQVSGGLTASPSAVANTGGLMLGCSDLTPACIITPRTTGRIYIMCDGVVAQSTTADGAFWHIRIGTGAAPANGAALTGTQYGGQQSMTYLTGILSCPFSIQALAASLTLGTAYWIDLVLGTVSAGTATMTQVNITAVELQDGLAHLRL